MDQRIKTRMKQYIDFYDDGSQLKKSSWRKRFRLHFLPRNVFISDHVKRSRYERCR